MRIKMRRRLLQRVLILALGAFILIALADPQAVLAQKIELKAASILYPSPDIPMSMGQCFQICQEEVTKRTKWDVTFETFWGATLGPGPEHIELVRKGVVDLAGTFAWFTPERFPLGSYPRPVVTTPTPAPALAPAKLKPLVPPPGFPARDTTMIVAFTPGGSSDMQLRLVQKYWKEVFPNNLIIVHRTGAGGEVGFRELARSAPDGYTLGGINIPHIVLQPLARDTGFTHRSFAYICQMVDDPQVIAVQKDSPIRDVADIISRAQAAPGRLTVGNVGTFTGHHVTTLLFQQVTNTRFTIIPYVGAADQLVAVRGRHVDFIISNLSDVTPHLADLRVFAIATEARHPLQPTWPTLKELGIPVVTSITRGVAAPAGIDPAILRYYREGFARLSAIRGYQEDMAKIGQTYDYLPGEVYEANIAKDAVRGENVLRLFGLIK